MDESILIDRLKRKDNSAFKEIVDTWQKMVLNTVLNIIQNVEDAEDVAQEVFVQVHESIGDFKGESKLSTWLYGISVSKAMDYLRRKKTKKRFAFVQSLFGKNDQLSHDPPDFFHPGIIAEKKDDAAALFKALSTLPPNQNTSFVLNKIQGLNYQEVSEVMKISVSAVDSLLQRAKTNLRKYLQNYYEDKF